MTVIRVILIPGAGSGIGRSTALYFARQSWPAGVLDLKSDDVDATVNEIEHAGGLLQG